MNTKVHAFTLIELVIVIAIIGIIAGIGVPNYLDYTRKARRSDAHITLLERQFELEMHYEDNQEYPSSLTSAQTNSKNGYYTISISTPSGAQSYTLSASATGTQANDLSCRTITITSTGVRSALDSGGSVSNDCW